jgi:hypothetical protein
VHLPAALQLTFDDRSDARLLALVRQVPDELWGAKLALQVGHKLLLARAADCLLSDSSASTGCLL